MAKKTAKKTASKTAPASIPATVGMGVLSNLVSKARALVREHELSMVPMHVVRMERICPWLEDVYTATKEQWTEFDVSSLSAWWKLANCPLQGLGFGYSYWLKYLRPIFLHPAAREAYQASPRCLFPAKIGRALDKLKTDALHPSAAADASKSERASYNPYGFITGGINNSNVSIITKARESGIGVDTLRDAVERAFQAPKTAAWYSADAAMSLKKQASRLAQANAMFVNSLRSHGMAMLLDGTAILAGMGGEMARADADVREQFTALDDVAEMLRCTIPPLCIGSDAVEPDAPRNEAFKAQCGAMYANVRVFYEVVTGVTPQNIADEVETETETETETGDAAEAIAA